MKTTAATLLFLSSMAIGMDRGKSFSLTVGKDRKLILHELDSALLQEDEAYYIPEVIRQLRDDKEKIIEQLSLDWWSECMLAMPESPQSFDAEKKPKEFLQYIYYWRYRHKAKSFATLIHNQRHYDVFNTILDYNLDGCGALGAAVVAKDINKEEKTTLVNAVLFFNFKPTKKDLNLAYLDLWERTQEDSTRKALLCFGSKDENSILSCLPFELIKLIAQFIEPAEKPLLPRKFFENGIVRVQPIEREV